MGLRLLGGAAIAAIGLWLVGCELLDSTCDETEDTCLGRNVKGRGVGASCEFTVECGVGLICQDSVCVPRSDAEQGETCRRTSECDEGLYCSGLRVCEPHGEGAVGDPCSDSSDCAKGLRCDLSPRGVPLRCAEAGDKELNEPCAGSDCVAGLNCVPVQDENLCLSVDVGREVPSLIPWQGTRCETEEGPAVAHFQVPRDGQDMDFYRLPFPNDIRKKSGKLDLSEHPKPPQDQIPIAARFIEAGDGQLEGFATNPVIYFRFSQEYRFGDASGDTIMIVDITPDSPNYDRSTGIRWKTTRGPVSNYICPNWLAVRPSIGRPLRPETTYAAILTTGIRREQGDAFERSEDFEAMLASATPGDEELARAHEAYEPLRQWLDDRGFDESSILNAAVFTTLDPEAPIRALATAVADMDPPQISTLVACDQEEKSPCETEGAHGEARGVCLNSGDGFIELHGRIELPLFQEGTLPYEEEGGALSWSSDGEPQVTDRADVCFALSIPERSRPDEGWPLLIYAHGTGGSFTGQMGAGGFAEEMANAGTPAATLALDMPMHGDRRGDSDLGPESLFFNIINPVAARDNVLQGSADLLSLVRFATQEHVRASDSPTGDEISFDSARIAIMGHSQGATHAAIMLPYASGIAGGVLSGVGGHLISSLLNKTQPQPIAQAIGAMLFDLDDEDLAGDSFNPALSLIQNFYESGDPINFGHRIYHQPTDLTSTGMHLFMSYGVNDNYSPEQTQAAYARAARLPHVGPSLVPINLEQIEAPASNTVTAGGSQRTVGVRQFEFDDDGDDGHFVAVRRNGPGHADVVKFLTAVMAGETPEIGAE